MIEVIFQATLYFLRANRCIFNLKKYVYEENIILQENQNYVIYKWKWK